MVTHPSLFPWISIHMAKLTSTTRVPSGEGIQEDESKLSFFDFMSQIIQDRVQLNTPTTLTLENPSNLHNATLGIAHDRIIHASTGDIAGELAFYELMSWSQGQITQELDHYAPVNIHTSLTRLMLDAYWFLRSRRSDTHDRELDLAARSLELSEASMELLQNKKPWYMNLSSDLDELSDVLGHVIIGKRGEVFVDQGASIERAQQMISALPIGENVSRMEIVGDRRRHLLLPVESRGWLYIIMRGEEPLVRRVIEQIQTLTRDI